MGAIFAVFRFQIFQNRIGITSFPSPRGACLTIFALYNNLQEVCLFSGTDFAGKIVRQPSGCVQQEGTGWENIL